MSLESSVYDILSGDATLMSLVTGGVKTSGELGMDGITRHTSPGSFTASGFLKPTILVRQRGMSPDGFLRDGMAKEVSLAQVVEVWIYQDQGSYSAIDSIIPRVFSLLEGEILGDGFPAELVNVLDREVDPGALSGSSMARMDFLVNTIMTGV